MFGTRVKEGEGAVEVGDRRLRRYAIVFVVLALAGCFLPLLIAPTEWFLEHDDYPSLRQMGYGRRTAHLDCDVVLYGDSTALTGLDPKVVGGITGMKACNVAEVGGILWVTGSEYPLDMYLKSNKRPRYVVFMYGASATQPFSGPFAGYAPEGMVYLLHYDRGAKLYVELLEHPTWVIRFSMWAGGRVMQNLVRRLTHGEPVGTAALHAREERDAGGGVWPFPLPNETKCLGLSLPIPAKSLPAFSRGMEEVRSHFSVEGTRVLIDLSPLPECDPYLREYRRDLAGMHDNAVEALPIGNFNDGDRHMNAVGGAYISEQVGRQIAALEEARKTQVSGRPQ